MSSPLFEEYMEVVASKDYLSINDLIFLHMTSNLLQQAYYGNHPIAVQ